MDILFSIIIPTLNEEKYIGRTLQSIVSQKHQGQKQIIISDNGSTDKTIDIAKEFGAYIVTGAKPNNIGSTRKLACFTAKKLAKNSGHFEEIIIATDADTTLSAGYIETIYGLYSQNPLIATSSGPFKTIINEKVLKFGNYFHKFNFFLGALDLQLWWLLKKINNNALLYGLNTVIRRSAYEKIGGFDELAGGSDMDLTLKVISSGNQVYYEENQLVTTSSRKFIDGNGHFSFRKAYKYAFQRESIKHARIVLKKRFRQVFIYQNT